jgi:cytochrome c biogenesis protein CcdA
VLGVLTLSAAPAAFLGAVINASDRAAFIVVGLLLIVLGTALLRAKAITGDQIDPDRWDR